MLGKACAICGRTKNVHIHHKDGNHKNNTIENLIELCAICHPKLHKNKLSLTALGLENTHISEKLFGSRNGPDQYIRLRDDVFRSANYYLHEEGTKISGVPGVKQKLTTYVNECLMNDLAAKGHYPPKDTMPVENQDPQIPEPMGENIP